MAGRNRSACRLFGSAVLGVHPADPTLLVAPEQLHLLETFANQIALAVE